MSDESITIAHISDLHVDGSRHKHERAARVIGYVARLPSPPDVVVLTGDLADTGAPAEYDELRELFAELRDPPLMCPGNHDDRAAFRQHLLGTPGGESPINQARHAAGALFALCDSSVPGKAGGGFDEETLGWLDRTLGDNGDLKAFVACHHPPATLHSPFIDAIKLDDEEALARVIRRHDNVVAMLCGHAHTPAVTTFANRPLLLAPGVSSTSSCRSSSLTAGGTTTSSTPRSRPCWRSMSSRTTRASRRTTASSRRGRLLQRDPASSH